MANGYTVLWTSPQIERVERQWRREGYDIMFACTHGEPCGPIPKAIGYTGLEGGWEMRRKLRAWCKAKGISDYRILRNTGYVRDLHGDVYELWCKRSDPADAHCAAAKAEYKPALSAYDGEKNLDARRQGVAW